MIALNDRWRLRERKREYQPAPLCFILMDDKIVMGETRGRGKKGAEGKENFVANEKNEAAKRKPKRKKKSTLE